MMASVHALPPPGPAPLLDLSFLTEDERMIILRVLKADEELRKMQEEAQKRKIMQERQNQKELSEKKKCGCCGDPFADGNGATCPECNHQVCQKCQRRTEGAPGFYCTLCSKEKLIKLQSQDYMPVLCSNSPPPSLYGSELVRKSLEVSTAKSPAQAEKKKRTSGAVSPNKEKRPRKASETPKANGFSRQNPVNTNPSAFTVLRRSESAESLNSLSSVYIESCGQGNYQIKGKLKTGVWYKQNEEQLYVRIASAKGLSAAKGDGTSNPYVKVYLLPDKSKQTKRMTGIQRKTCNPTYNEILKYKVAQSDLSMHTLWLSVWDWDKFGRNHFLGEVRLPLGALDLTDSTDRLYDLREMQDGVDEVDFKPCGMLLLSLKYVPNSPSSSPKQGNSTSVQTIGTLHVLIKQAKELPSLGPNGETNCFVKSYLLPNKSYGSKKKTKVVEKNLNPEWQEEITYKFLSLSELRSERALEMTLWDNDRRGTNEFLGCVRIGPNPKRVRTPKDWMDSTGEEVSHWEAMLTRPGEWVEQWHTLRPSTDHPGVHKMEQSLTGRAQLPLAPPLQDEATDKITPLNSPTHDTLGMEERTSSLGERPKKGRGHKRSGSEDIGRGRSSTLPTRGKTKSGSSISAMKMKPSDSVTSLSRSGKGNYTITGEVNLGVEYKTNELLIHVKRAKGLAVPNQGYGFSDPYVKTYLLPDKSKHSKRKTEIKRKTLNPVYNETLRYSVVQDDLKQRAVWLSIWDQDRFGSNKFLGELCLPLSSLDLSDPTPYWYKLQDFAEAGGILPSTPVPSVSSPTSPNPPVGGMPTPFQAAQSEPRRKLLEEEPTESAKPAE